MTKRAKLYFKCKRMRLGGKTHRYRYISKYQRKKNAEYMKKFWTQKPLNPANTVIAIPKGSMTFYDVNGNEVTIEAIEQESN